MRQGRGGNSGELLLPVFSLPAPYSPTSAPKKVCLQANLLQVVRGSLACLGFSNLVSELFR